MRKGNFTSRRENIMIIEQGEYLHLQGKNISYILRIHKAGYLLHHYFGKKLRPNDYTSYPAWHRSFYTYNSDKVFLEGECQEYPTFGYIDLKLPALKASEKGKTAIFSFKYKRHEIKEGKPDLPGLPSSKANGANCQTLIVVLSDEAYGVEIELSYTVFDDSDIIARSVKIINAGKDMLRLEKVFSCSLDIAGKTASETDFVFLGGTYAEERKIKRRALCQGISEIGSMTGESSHYLNPFIALCDRSADRNKGDVLGFMLVYSGNHRFQVNVDPYDRIRVMCGIHDGDFAWELQPGESFVSPECLLGFSEEGLNGIGHCYHDFLNGHILPQRFMDVPRPVLINSWESTYFAFDEQKLLSIAKHAKEAGIELFVLDDGWFGKRNDDTCSLGDWSPNLEKLPDGVSGLAKKVNALGMKFGIWVEPEMISPRSELAEKNPEFAISCARREPALSRNQQVLDLTNPEVVAFVKGFLDKLLSSADISYIKWDMNRPLSEVPEPGFVHRYYLGLYDILGFITEKYPHVLFEGCSGGGGRFDAGMLCYSPQIWASDDSDAIERLQIQEGTALCYPLSTIGAHVTICPNHQVGRITPLSTRANIATFGTFGYELDVARLSDAEKGEIKNQIERYHRLEMLVRKGDFSVLRSAYDGGLTAWQVTSKDKGHVLVLVVRALTSFNMPRPEIRLKDLEADFLYTDTETGKKYYGDELMYKGFLAEPEYRDFSSLLIEFIRE